MLTIEPIKQLLILTGADPAEIVTASYGRGCDRA